MSIDDNDGSFIPIKYSGVISGRKCERSITSQMVNDVDINKWQKDTVLKTVKFFLFMFLK